MQLVNYVLLWVVDYNELGCLDRTGLAGSPASDRHGSSADGGGRYKTPEMEVEHALELLKLHVKNHEQQQDNSGYATRVKPQFG